MGQKSTCLLAFLFIGAVSTDAQQFEEASGQTKAFNLSAGAKAGWDSGGIGILLCRVPPGRPSGIAAVSMDKAGMVTFTLVKVEHCGPALVGLAGPDGRMVRRFELAPGRAVSMALGRGFHIANIRPRRGTAQTLTFLTVR